jgi:hypothetical protein
MSNPNHDPKSGEFASGHNAGEGNRKVADNIAELHKKAGPAGYHIVDSHTGKVVGKARTSVGASRSVDKRDNAYGGYHHRRVPIYDKEKF